jgi:Skp family chaperone for outer membrane proteins
MKRLLVGGALLVSVLLVVNLLSVIFVSADENWEMGDLSRVAALLEVQPGPDGKYDLSSVLSALFWGTERANHALSDMIIALAEESHAPLMIAYLDTDSAFAVFTDAVKDLRQAAQDKANQISALQWQYDIGALTKSDFDAKNNQYKAELLQAQLAVDLDMIDKMIASRGFSDLKVQLQQIRKQAQPIVEQMNSIVTTARMGVVNVQEFENHINAVETSFSELDKLLTQASLVKITAVSRKVAVQNGYDLVLQKKNVIIYQNSAKLTDITNLVKQELATYL